MARSKKSEMVQRLVVHLVAIIMFLMLALQGCGSVIEETESIPTPEPTTIEEATLEKIAELQKVTVTPSPVVITEDMVAPTPELTATPTPEPTATPTVTPTPTNTPTPTPIFVPEKDIVNLESYPKVTYSRDLSEYDINCLARIVMAEAEGQSTHVKALIAFTVLNRVNSRGIGFPNTVEEVITQHREVSPSLTIYQYVHAYRTDYSYGRYYWVKPNEDCWRAIEIVLTTEYDFSNGSLYYESNSNVEDSWIIRNCEPTVEVDGTRFYK